jgi:hypothetical protein
VKQTFRLNHARAGENYTGTLLPINESEKKITFLDIKIPHGLSLTPNLSTGIISGLVDEPGEFDILIKYFSSGGKPVREELGIATLLVVPNPKLMWKDIPSPRTAPYWVPDEKHSAITSAGFSVTAASKRGRSHAHAGSFRDDDYAVVSDGVWLIAVVADGAGSAKYSRKGANVACETSSHYLLNHLHKIDDFITKTSSSTELNPGNIKLNTDRIKEIFTTILTESLQYSLNEIKNECNNVNGGTELREFSTTTLIAMTRKINDAILVVTYSVGDGAIALYHEKQNLNLLSCGDSGEYAGQTRFLDDIAVTYEEVSRRSQITLVQDMSSLILMSDGVSDPFFETDNQLLDVSRWDSLWKNLKDENVISGMGANSRLLNWLDFWSKGNHDDRTIVIITQE